jgi:lipopolysaccharide/colanic/teichoic acid biosynthesis glycosyltransferase
MYDLAKRFLDIFVSLVGTILLLPLFIAIIILLRFTAEGEVFYLQERFGYQNTKFKILKFATMLKNSMNMGTGSITLQNDFRVTPVGKYLRKTKINELPQIINILKGDISIVGPRPLVENDFRAYEENVRKIIYNVKPGLTGLGSIVFRDEEKIISENFDKINPHTYYKEVIAPYKAELELYYQVNQTFVLDLKIIFLTLWVVIIPNSRLYFKLFKDLPKREF